MAGREIRLPYVRRTIPGSALRRRVVSSVFEVEGGGWWFVQVLLSPSCGFLSRDLAEPGEKQFYLVFAVATLMCRLAMDLPVFPNEQGSKPMSSDPGF